MTPKRTDEGRKESEMSKPRERWVVQTDDEDHNFDTEAKARAEAEQWCREGEYAFVTLLHEVAICRANQPTWEESK